LGLQWACMCVSQAIKGIDKGVGVRQRKERFLKLAIDGTPHLTTYIPLDITLRCLTRKFISDLGNTTRIDSLLVRN